METVSMPTNDDDQLLTARQAGKARRKMGLVGEDPKTILAWHAAGKLRASGVNGNNDPLFRRGDVLAVEARWPKKAAAATPAPADLEADDELDDDTPTPGDPDHGG